MLDVNTEEKAEKFIKQPVFLPKIESVEKDASQELIGYTLRDKNSDFEGKIESIIEGANPLFEIISSNDKEVLIPAVSEFIVQIEDEKQIIWVELPEGLIDL